MDGKATIGKGFKCNIFVYEMLVAGGVNIPLVQLVTPMAGYTYNTKNIIPRVEDWHERKVPGMQYIGKGVEALNKSWPGDILVIFTGVSTQLLHYGHHHIGIISGPQKTISASSNTDTIVENDWGWRADERNDAEVFRYHP